MALKRRGAKGLQKTFSCTWAKILNIKSDWQAIGLKLQNNVSAEILTRT